LRGFRDRTHRSAASMCASEIATLACERSPANKSHIQSQIQRKIRFLESPPPPTS
jgi:hypothetical protein